MQPNIKSGIFVGQIIYSGVQNCPDVFSISTFHLTEWAPGELAASSFFPWVGTSLVYSHNKFQV